MPVIMAILGAIFLGLFYWLMWGQGIEYIEHRWTAARKRRSDTETRAKALESQQMAPLRAIDDARDAAVMLMILMGRIRGILTPEQQSAIEEAMRRVLDLEGEVTARFLYAQYAAEQVKDFDKALEGLSPLLREKLGRSERADLFGMLETVAKVHGGPTHEQDKALGRVTRLMRQHA
jgi:hypothetical protein